MHAHPVILEAQSNFLLKTNPTKYNNERISDCFQADSSSSALPPSFLSPQHSGDNARSWMQAETFNIELQRSNMNHNKE